jgi:cytochrome c553
VRSIASATAKEKRLLQRGKADVNRVAVTSWRSLALGLAAALFCAAPALAQSGTTLAEKLQLCGACHGEDGNSKLEKIPSLAGQPAFFILNQLFLMREGVRKVEAMALVVKDLKDEDLQALSEHFAKLPAKRSDEPIDAVQVKTGTEIATHRRCDSCHQKGLVGAEQIPRLAKQRVDYLVLSLKAFRDTTREGGDTAMSANLAGASDADLVALAHYCASQ